MRGVPGTTCKLTLNTWHGGPLPEEGDFLRTTAGSCYLIDEVRRARPGAKRVATVHCTRLEKDAVEDGQEGVHLIQWDARGRR